MHSKPIVFVSILAATLAACAGSVGAPTAPAATTPVALATLTATSVPEATTTGSPASEPPASPGGGGGAQPTPGAIDPCTLLTADQASKAIGKKLGAGVSSTLDPDRVCTFKNGLSEVKVILAPPAPDAATAQAYWDAERAQVPADIQITDLSYFDRSAYGSGSAAGASISGMFVIDGNYFFDFYCGFPACSQTASVAASQFIAGRLP